MHPEDFLTLEEWHRLLAATPTPRDAAVLWLMAGCGLRVSEAAALKVEHLDSPGGYLHIVNGKGGKQRTSILPEPKRYPIRPKNFILKRIISTKKLTEV